MEKAKLFLLGFILIPSIVTAGSQTTGDASSRSTGTIKTDGENVIIQNNTVTSISNTGNNNGSDSISTGDASAVSEVNINNGSVEGQLKVEVNGQEKNLQFNKPGNYILGINAEGNVTASSESKTEQNPSKPTPLIYFEKLIDFLFGFFKK